MLNNTRLNISKKAPSYVQIFKGDRAVIKIYFLLLPGLHLGSILASVSPAIVAPPVNKFDERGIGTKNQIAPLVLNAGGIDTAFTEGVCGVINSAIFYPAPLVYRIVKVNPSYKYFYNKKLQRKPSRNILQRHSGDLYCILLLLLKQLILMSEMKFGSNS